MSRPPNPKTPKPQNPIKLICIGSIILSFRAFSTVILKHLVGDYNFLIEKLCPWYQLYLFGLVNTISIFPLFKRSLKEGDDMRLFIHCNVFCHDSTLHIQVTDQFHAVIVLFYISISIVILTDVLLQGLHLGFFVLIAKLSKHHAPEVSPYESFAFRESANLNSWLFHIRFQYIELTGLTCDS